jgi:hypothetical protein
VWKREEKEGERRRMKKKKKRRRRTPGHAKSLILDREKKSQPDPRKYAALRDNINAFARAFHGQTPVLKPVQFLEPSSGPISRRPP